MHERIPDNQKHYNFAGTFEQVKPFLLKAYTEALEEIRPCILSSVQSELLELIGQLCHPIPDLRGNPQGIGAGHTPYSLERYISIIDRLSKKAART
jgi:hypothetical protein